MQVEAKLELDTQRFTEWSPQEELDSVTDNQIMFGRGLYCVNLDRLFPLFSEYWLPLFSGLGVDVRFNNSQVIEVFPTRGISVFSCRVNGEVQVFGVDLRLAEALAELVAPQSISPIQQIIFDYFVRRFYSVMSSTWCGSAPLQVEYCYPGSTGAVDVAGVIASELIIGNAAYPVYFGLGPELASLIDEVSVNSAHLEHELAAIVGDSESVVISVEMMEVIDTGLSLVDLVGTSSVVSFEVPNSYRVILSVNEVPVGVGMLKQYGGHFVVHVSHMQKKFRHVVTSKRTTIEIGAIEVPREDAGRYLQSGAIIPLQNRVTDDLSLVCDAEHYGEVRLGVVDGQMAVMFIRT